jgi:hypothetical protein
MPRLLFWLVGLGSLVWLALRSGFNPRRLSYPCQRAALANSLAFLGYLGSLLGLTQLRRLLQHKKAVGAASLALMIVLAAVLTSSQPPIQPAAAKVAALPSWTSPSAVSNVFAVQNVPVPTCSLDGGALPPSGSCHTPSVALADAGVDQLINEMEARGDYFYRTASHTSGILATNDVVVIKINNQWGEQGSGNGWGRLSTNTDVLKGLLWRIVNHPDGFTGEVVIAENTQGAHAGVWNDDPANAQDQGQSYQDVVDAFVSLGYPVSLFSWDGLNGNLISGGSVGAAGYPTGEYAKGNTSNAYILLEDPAGSGTNELSYPKFRTSRGTYVSMRYGIWNGSSYNADRLTFINLPDLKVHVMAGATIAWKNYIGFLTIGDHGSRFNYGSSGDSWNDMHGFFWGWEGYGDTDYGGIGRQLAFIRTADLNIVDAIWVATDANYYGEAVRQDVLLASRDPFAVDWYASEYILHGVATSPDGTSAARAGTFRTATRTVQNVAQAVWPGTYPYIDLLDSYNGTTPSNAEKNQMNVYIAGSGNTCQPITAVNISGPVLGDPGVSYPFSAILTPLSATQPITYTWDNSDQTATSSRTFSVLGGYDLSVTVSNPCSGPLSDDHHISIQVLEHNYLPFVIR